MLILGIDPGSTVTGYGVIESTQGDVYACGGYGTIRPGSDKQMPDRLKKIYDGLTALIDSRRPDIMALEDIFFGQNVQAALKLGQVRGAVIIAGINAGIPIKTYAAREVKQSLTGNGAASKEQVQRMVRERLSLRESSLPLDASDALAIALCHAQRWWTEQKLKNMR